MNDEQIVLALLDFYKRKGIDLYKVLDDPSFKALSLDTKLAAIKRYAQLMTQDLGLTAHKRDFKVALKDILFETGKGAVMGGLTSLGAARMFVNGKVPYAPILIGGAGLGAMGGLASAIVDSVHAANERRFMESELKRVVEKPTDHNAVGVLSALHLRPKATGMGGSFNKFLDKVKDDFDKKVDTHAKETFTSITDAYNEHDLGNPRVM